MTSPGETKTPGYDHKLAQAIRILPLIFFGVIAWLVLMATFVISAVQFVVVLVKDEPNGPLRDFGARAGAYMSELIDYLFYRTDDMPAPFASLPAAGEPAPAAEPAKPKKPKARKSVAKKAAVKKAAS